MVTIWLPNERPPFFHCRICKATFGEDESKRFERHVVACAKAHEAEIHDAGPQKLHPAWFTAWDPELERYIKERVRVAPDGSWKL